MELKFYLVFACLHISTTLPALFPWNCTLARRHNLTFHKGQLPASKGLNIDSGWWLTDISFGENDLTKEFQPNHVRFARGGKKSNPAPRSAGCSGLTGRNQSSTQPDRQLLFTELSGIHDTFLQPSLLTGGDGCVHMTFHEHFTSWICRWQTQLNPQPQPIAALAWQSHCGSCWCPLGALQRQGDRGQGFKQPTSDTGCILTQLNHAVSTQQDQWDLWVS